MIQIYVGEVENKIPDTSKLVKKRDYDTKITDIDGKYFTTIDYNKYINDILESKRKLKNLIDQTDISDIVKGPD